MTQTLAELMATAAREMSDSATVETLLDDAVHAAVRDIDPCDAAAVSIVERGGRIDSPAASTGEARRSDELQYELCEGPCLDSIWREVTVTSPDLRDDPRWPGWGQRMTEEIGFRSLVAVQLYTNGDNLGALNLYSREVDAFGPADIAYAEAMAAHLAVALLAARHVEQLDEGLATRTTIGIAIGIMMERYGITADAAFATLHRVSSHTNRKLRDIAEEIASGGVLPDS